MGGPDLSQISSNWKKLQEKLSAEKKEKKPSTAAADNGLKRKRAPEKSKSTTNGVNKKQRISAFEAKKAEKKGQMGGYLSTPAEKQDSKAQKLINDHDIDPSAVTAAYGATTQKSHSPKDDINGGLHPSHKVGKYLALDCEMVGTGPPPHADNVLARASLVNFHGEQIYDSYVQAPQGIKVEDYRTFVSGIKPHHMRPGYARPFTEVQNDVANLLDGRILVGHALRNDLSTLLLSHPKRDLRDTARHPKFRIESRGKAPALRNLAKSELGLDIQTGEHSSVEDARAAMLLFQKEKSGFEEENRKHFGQRTKSASVKASGKAKEVSPSVDDEEEDEDEDEDDLDLLDGEEEAEMADEMPSTSRSTQPKAKKRKKKKRTKRK